MFMRKSRTLFLVGAMLSVACVSFGVTPVPVKISSLVNADLTGYSHGYEYPPKGGPLTVNGVPFVLSTLASNSHTAIIQANPAAGAASVHNIPVNAKGVETVYTLINSAWGRCGTQVGELDFIGAKSETYVYKLTEGVNIRDHNQASWCNFAATVAGTANYGGGQVRLDMQQIPLPASFSSDVLTAIVFKGYGKGYGGSPFIAAITVGDNVGKLQITFDGQPVTSEQTVALGQQINLGVNLVPTNPDAVAWTIRGETVGGFNPPAACPTASIPKAKCIGETIPAPDPHQPSLSYYWVAPGTFEVQAAWHADNGATLEAKAAFKVVGPTHAELIASTPGDTVLFPLKAPNKISCGTPEPASAIEPCIRFDASMTSPYVYNLEFVQVVFIDTDAVKTKAGKSFTCSGGTGLDNDYPYPKLKTATGGYYTDDLPDRLLSPRQVPHVISHSIQFRAETYLMWKAVLPDAESIFVPLGSKEWEWRAQADLVSDSWKLISGSMTAGGLRAPAYPTWLNVDSNSDVDQCH